MFSSTFLFPTTTAAPSFLFIIIGSIIFIIQCFALLFTAGGCWCRLRFTTPTSSSWLIIIIVRFSSLFGVNGYSIIVIITRNSARCSTRSGGIIIKIIIIAAAALFPLYLNTHSGVRNVDRKILEAGKVFGLRGLGLVRHVILPEAIPSVLVGLRVSLSVSLLALIVAEMSNAPRGIGFLMVSAQQYFQMDVLVVCVLIYAVWGLSVDLVVRLLERVLLPYKRLGRKP